MSGDPVTPHSEADNLHLAHDLAELIRALRAVDTSGRGFQDTGRGGHLPDHGEWVARCIHESEGLLDTAAMTSGWARLRALPRRGADVMSHTDLIPGNILANGAHLAGILDTGGFQPADPALDLVCAWHLFDEKARAILREELDRDDLEWDRGKAWAFEPAAGPVWYYQDINPAMAELGRTTLVRLHAEIP